MTAVCALNGKALRPVAEWIDRYRVFWSNRLVDLKQFAEAEQ